MLPEARGYWPRSMMREIFCQKRAESKCRGTKKPGWKLELRKDTAGKLVGAVWSGSKIGPREVAEFTFTARNPNEETKLEWKVVQVYEDGSRSEWTGPAGSRTPASVTTIKKTYAIRLVFFRKKDVNGYTSRWQPNCGSSMRGACCERNSRQTRANLKGAL